jgi:hypothetical protein
VVDGDRGLLRRMVEVFLGQCPKLLGDIGDSILHGDCVALVRAAHKLTEVAQLAGCVIRFPWEIRVRRV